MRGLLGRSELGPDEALLLERARSVHTFGMRFEIAAALRLGTRVDLVLHFEQQQKQIKLRSSVIWEYTLDDGKQPRGYGLGLADLRAEERSFLDEFLRSGGRAGVTTTSR